MIREIVHININVADIARSVDFYRKLGFEIMHEFGELPGPGRPARDFGVARVAAGPARGGVADRSEVYLGACLVWMSGRDLSVERRPPDD